MSSNQGSDDWKKLVEASKQNGRSLENNTSQPNTENNPPTNEQVFYKTKQRLNIFFSNILSV